MGRLGLNLGRQKVEADKRLAQNACHLAWPLQGICMIAKPPSRAHKASPPIAEEQSDDTRGMLRGWHQSEFVSLLLALFEHVSRLSAVDFWRPGVRLESMPFEPVPSWLIDLPKLNSQVERISRDFNVASTHGRGVIVQCHLAEQHVEPYVAADRNVKHIRRKVATISFIAFNS